MIEDLEPVAAEAEADDEGLIQASLMALDSGYESSITLNKSDKKVSYASLTALDSMNKYPTEQIRGCCKVALYRLFVVWMESLW